MCISYLLIKHFREFFEEQTMMKKWLCGVALGALLMASEAFGVTIHEVLSNDFWSAEHRGTLSYLKDITKGYYKEKWKWETSKTIIQEDGSELKVNMRVVSCQKSSIASWKSKEWYNTINQENTQDKITSFKLTAHRKMYKEKSQSQNQGQSQLVYSSQFGQLMLDEEEYQHQSVYINKPRKKDVRPIGPYVVEDWFPDAMESRSWQKTQFYGTEHTAVTNIISDNEAYITGNISQTGHIDECDGYIVNEDTSLLRTYTQHITTDADHVYVEQEITENVQNDPYYNSQNIYQTQYTATFKKGRWKEETETISQVSHKEATPWLRKYYDMQNEH